MKKASLFLFVLFQAVALAETPREFLENAVKAMSAKKSVEYDYVYRRKYLADEDILTFTGKGARIVKVHMFRDTA